MDETTEKAIKALRRDLSKRASVPNGTVVRVSIAGRYGTVLTYAVVWVAETQLWYPTGNKASMAHQQFLDWVGAAQTVEAAIEWEVPVVDPNVLAARIRALAEQVLADNDEGPDVDLAETVLDLFEWLARGGYAPDWRGGLMWNKHEYAKRDTRRLKPPRPHLCQCGKVWAGTLAQAKQERRRALMGGNPNRPLDEARYYQCEYESWHWTTRLDWVS